MYKIVDHLPGALIIQKNIIILTAFVSYASQDRHRVAIIIQGMKKTRPDMAFSLM